MGKNSIRESRWETYSNEYRSKKVQTRRADRIYSEQYQVLIRSVILTVVLTLIVDAVLD